MVKAALRVVERPAHYVEEVKLWSSESAPDAHSLHYVAPYADSFPVELPAAFINKYTRRGDVVLDPFCGSGTTPLEAALQGRVPYASDINPFAAKVTQAKLSPADITEVTLWLQRVNLDRPAALDQYRPLFSEFYDVDTFREIVNLRALTLGKTDRVTAFVQAVALGLLHGHSAGYFSVYTFPQISLGVEEQRALNNKRRQTPEYRSVAPRILRKAALLGRDGLSSSLKQAAAYGFCGQADVRNLSHLSSACVDLVVTAPPLPALRDYLSDQWLRLWFLGQSVEQVRRKSEVAQTVDGWCDFMNEALLELARVVKAGGRAIFDLREVRFANSSVCLDEELLLMVSRDLSRYWEPEVTLIQRQPVARIKNGLKERDEERQRASHRMLVLRRK